MDRHCPARILPAQAPPPSSQGRSPPPKAARLRRMAGRGSAVWSCRDVRRQSLNRRKKSCLMKILHNDPLLRRKVRGAILGQSMAVRRSVVELSGIRRCGYLSPRSHGIRASDPASCGATRYPKLTLLGKIALTKIAARSIASGAGSAPVWALVRSVRRSRGAGREASCRYQRKSERGVPSSRRPPVWRSPPSPSA